MLAQLAPAHPLLEALIQTICLHSWPCMARCAVSHAGSPPHPVGEVQGARGVAPRTPTPAGDLRKSTCTAGIHHPQGPRAASAGLSAQLVVASTASKYASKLLAQRAKEPAVQVIRSRNFGVVVVGGGKGPGQSGWSDCAAARTKAAAQADLTLEHQGA